MPKIYMNKSVSFYDTKITFLKRLSACILQEDGYTITS